MQTSHLVLTNQLTATNFTPVYEHLPMEASSIGCLPRDESKWIQWHQESIATCVDNVYGRHGGSSQESAARCCREKNLTVPGRWAGRNSSNWKCAHQCTDQLQQVACIPAFNHCHRRNLAQVEGLSACMK